MRLANLFRKQMSAFDSNKKCKAIVLKVAKCLTILFYALVYAGLMYLMLFKPEVCLASVESSLNGLKSKLTGVILPTLAVCGLVFAGFSFYTGQERAKQHIMYAVIGCIIGYGAQAIVDFLSQTVN